MLRHPTTTVLASLFVFLLLLSPAAVAVVSAEQDFMDLVKDVPADRLHAALHEYTGEKFKHGVFPADRSALEAVHRERAADASRIVQLAKRQTVNETTVVTSAQPSSTLATVTVPSTQAQTSNTPASSSQPAATPSSAAETPSTNAQSTPTSETPSSTEQPATSATPEQTTAATTKPLTSYTSTLTRTLTGADGAQSTVTQTTVVVPTQAEATASGTSKTSSSKTTSLGAPSLQTNAASAAGVGMGNFAAVGAALVGIFAL
ncbi:hypothetical protein RUND412_009260 [Rhizina undulata]